MKEYDRVNKSVKVLHVISTLRRGGLETWIMDIMREKEARNDDWVLDVCLIGNESGPYEEEFLALGGTIHRLPMNRWNLLGFLYRFYNVVSEGNYTIVHSHLYLFTSFLFLLPFGKRTRKIAHVHPVDDLKGNKLGRGKFQQVAKKVILKNADAVLAPSVMSKNSFASETEKYAEKLSVVYNGINPNRFITVSPELAIKTREKNGLPLDAKVVLNVARYNEHKRHTFLVDVAKEINKDHDDVYFVLIGDGPLRGKVMEMIGDAGLGERFRCITGAASIDEYFVAADLFAFPSINEGFGIVIIEAAAAGLPVVALKIPGVEEAAQACKSFELLDCDATPDDWVKAIMNRLGHGKTNADPQQFRFTIEKSYNKLRSIYNTVSVNRP